MWFQSNPEVSNLQSRKLTDVFFLFLFFLSLSLFLSNHNAISRLRPRQKMQRHREGLLCEWRRLLLHTWYKSALLQVSYLRRFFGFASKMKLFTVNLLCPNSFHDFFFFVVFFTLVIFHNSRFLILLFISLIALDFRSSSLQQRQRQQQKHITGKMLPVCLTTHLLCILALIMEWGGGALILLSHV